MCRQPAPEVNQEEERERLTVQLALAEAKLETREIDSAEQRAKAEELAAIVHHQARGKLQHYPSAVTLQLHGSPPVIDSPSCLQRQILEQSRREVDAQTKSTAHLVQSIQEGEQGLLQASQTIAQLQVS